MPFAAAAEPLPVLVVDDDSALNRTLSDILRLNGYAPSTAETAHEGLALARNSAPALAIVDLGLPDMNGIELASQLHALSEITQVVVLTGNASMESAVAALRGNTVDYLLKPVDVSQFLQVASLAGERWQRFRAEDRLRTADRIARESLELRARQQAAVAQLGQRAIVATDTLALFNDAATLVSETLEVPFVSVSERRSDGSALVLRAGIGWAREKIGHMLIPATEETHAGWSLLHNQSAVITDLAAEGRFPRSRVLADYGIASGVTAMIPGATTPYGVLGAHDVRPRQFSADDVHFLQAIAHILGTVVERSRTELAFRQAQRMEAVGRLASGVAHDFNNVLTAISGYAELLKGSLDESDIRRADTDEILKATGRAATLTRQLLAFSRQQVLQPRQVKLNDVVTDLQKMLARLVGPRVKIRLALDTNLAFVKADPGQVEQVLVNLAVNARDAMPSGGTLTIQTLNVHLERTKTAEMSIDEAGPYVMLAVSDTGTGMDADTKAKIFEPFFTTKGPEQGTGLGLATVYGIVKQSGGEIVVASEVGHGTTFRFFLPETR